MEGKGGGVKREVCLAFAVEAIPIPTGVRVGEEFLSTRSFTNGKFLKIGT